MGIAQLSRTGLILGAAFVFILSVCRADDLLFLGGLVAALILGWLIRTKSFRMSVVDWAVVAVWGAECALLAASVNMDRSFIGFKILTQSILFLFYPAYRLSVRTQYAVSIKDRVCRNWDYGVDCDRFVRSFLRFGDSRRFRGNIPFSKHI